MNKYFDMSSINSLNNSKEVFSALINVLEYKNSGNFSLDGNDDFDATYSVFIEDVEYVIVGIKILNDLSEEDIAKKHLYYWNKNEVPFSIMVLPGEIRIYNNFTTTDNKLLYKSNDRKSDQSVLELFSNKQIAFNAVYGKLEKLINKNERVDNFLLDNLRNTIKELHSTYKFKYEYAYNFMAQCIFVKYLEDRKMLTKTAFEMFGVDNFNDLLGIGNTEIIKSFFVSLKERFNGDLFDIEKDILPNQLQMKAVKSFFDGDVVYKDGSRQLTLFRYNFSVIPIELISNIYETFFNLGDSLLDEKNSAKNGAFYTPYYLAEFMNNECFAKIEKKDNIKVLDPACGSGVFLVGAFKRLVDLEIKKTKKLKQSDLKRILTKNVFGIDINKEALKITCFSLYIALLEYINPRDLNENNFKFPSLLNVSLFPNSFFDEKLDEKEICVDIIIGNPPWVSDKKGDHNEYCRKNKILISDGQIAQAFMARSKDFSNTNGIISLIVTNSIFINGNAEKFRNYILDKFRIVEILNLNKIKKDLFKHASAPCSIVTFKILKEPIDYTFDYFSFKPNLLTQLLNSIVYDKEEIIKVSKRIIKTKDYIWYILTNGDEYDIRVINKMKTFCPLSKIMNDRNELKYFRGYAIGNKKYPRKEYVGLKGGNLKNSFYKYYVDYNSIPEVTEENYERPRNLEQYSCKNKLLVKRTYNKEKSGAAFCEETVIFTDDFHCIKSNDESDKNFLLFLEAIFNSKVFLYYLFHASKILTAIKPEITKDNILSFPIPYNASDMQIREINDIATQLKELVKEEVNAEIFDLERESRKEQIESLQKKIDLYVYSLYDLDDIDIDVIEYTFANLNSKQQKDSKIELASEINYKAYSNEIIQYFNNFLTTQGYKMELGDILNQEIYTLMSFNIKSDEGNHSESSKAELLKILPDVLGLAALENIEDELIVKSKLSGFVKDGFFVVKTKEVNNWSKISALKDADYFTKLIFNNVGGGRINE